MAVQRGFLRKGRGLGRVNPLSPYIFVLRMEVLTLHLNRATANGVFQYHPKCKKVPLTHLCFADDLLILSEASLSSLLGIKEVMHQFYLMSGLKVSYSKSKFFIVGFLLCLSNCLQVLWA